MRIQDRYQGYILHQLWSKAIDKRVRMRMQKIMILPICLGIFLVGIVMMPGVFADDGCGPGTVLIDGVCELAPVEPGEGCGPGTVMVNGVCELTESSGTSIPPLYIVGGAAAIGAAIIGIIFAVRRGSSETKTPKPAKKELEEYEEKYLAKQKPSPKPARQDLDDYEEQYLRRQGQRPTRKPAETRPTSSSCNSCGKPLKPTAKFCGKCGSKQ